ncbi:hypothetical protein, partial [Pseudomonas petroselini]|uniref:hypothetical protein n=1 Tax=Pseudomonas petroselini TaxID=2899822 RepID=UPI001E374094
MGWQTHRHREQAPSHSFISIHQVDISLILILVPSVGARAFVLNLLDRHQALFPPHLPIMTPAKP